MRKHTPGPWLLEETLPYFKVVGPDGFAIVIDVHPDDGALIAASPQILKALKRCIDDEDVAVLHGMGGLSAETYNEARAAIQKADGK